MSRFEVENPIELKHVGHQLVVRAKHHMDELGRIHSGSWSKSYAAFIFPYSPFVAAELVATVDLHDRYKEVLLPLLHRHEQLKLARRGLGRADLPPIPWPTKTESWSHQTRGWWFARDCLDLTFSAEELQHHLSAPIPSESIGGGCLLDMGMGSGKSKIAIDLLAHEGLEDALIVCPPAVIPAWKRQFEIHASYDYGIVVLRGMSEQRKRMLHTVSLHPGRRRVWLTNYEMIWREPLSSYFLKHPPSIIIADEIHRLKSSDGRASKYMSRLARKVKYRLGLSGTPLPHSMMDAYGVFRFLDPGIYGTSYQRFRSRYAIMGGFDNRQVVATQNEEDFHRRYFQITYRVKSEDVLDLPEKHHVRIDVELPKKARKIYQDLSKEMIAQVDDGVVTAANAAVKFIRLQQVTSGFVVPEGQDIGAKEIHAAKAEALSDILADLPPTEPVVVFSRFKWDLAAIKEVVRKLGSTSVELSGARKELEVWQEGAAQVLVTQIQAGAEGIDLTRACYAIYYSIGFSLGQFEQSMARLHRPGQERKVTYLHLVVPKSIDSYIYRALEKRKEVLTYVLDTLREAA